MIAALVWLATVVYIGWRLWQAGYVRAAVPTLAVMGWCTLLAFGLAWFKGTAAKRSARREAARRAEREAIKAEIIKEAARQALHNEGKGGL